MDHMEDAPREQDRVGGVVLYLAKFSTGHVACGDMNKEQGGGVEGSRRLRPESAHLQEHAVQPARIHPSRSHGDRTSSTMSRLQELQGMSVSNGQPVI